MNRYVRAVASNYAFWAVNSLFFLAITPVAINVMGDELYGLWVILNAILMFSSVGTLGMSVVVNKFGSEEGKESLDRDELFTAALVVLIPIAVCIGGGIFVLRDWLSARFAGAGVFSHQLRSALIFTSISLIPLFLSKVPQGHLYSQLRYEVARAIETGTAIAVWVIAVLIAFLRPDLTWMAAGAFVVYTISFLAYSYSALGDRPFEWRWSRAVFQKIRSFSAFTFIQSLAVSLYQNFDRILVGLILGPAPAGAYSVGTSVGVRLSVISGQVTEVLVPYASRKQSLEDNRQIYKTFRSVVGLINVLMLGLSTLLILWMDMILAIWIGPDFSESHAGVFRILILAYMLLSASRPGHQTLVGLGRVKVTAVIYLFTSLVMLASLVYASARWGLEGASFANLCMIMLLSFNFLVSFYLGEGNVARLFLKDLLPLILLPISAYILVAYLDPTVLGRILGSLLIIPVVAILWYSDSDFRRLVRRVVSELEGSLQAGS